MGTYVVGVLWPLMTGELSDNLRNVNRYNNIYAMH
jgi:hypothetical protein